MTREELIQKPPGTILDVRSLIIEGYEEQYTLGKDENNKYFISFSASGGGYGSRYVTEKDMVKLVNDKEISDIKAMDIYYLDPHFYYRASE